MWTHRLARRLSLTTFLRALSEKAATPLEKALGITFNEYEGRLYHKLFHSRLYSWITSCNFRSDRPMNKFGMQACPFCLAEDGEPYFRRRWRFAFVASCPRHECFLVDRCPACGNPIHFHHSASRWPQSTVNVMTICYECQFDFRDMARRKPEKTITVKPELVEFQEYLVLAAKQDYIQITGSEDIAARDFFDVLHWILSIIILPHKAARKIRASIFEYYDLNLDCSCLSKEQTLESLSTRDRSELIWLLSRLLVDRPDRYFRSCASHDALRNIWMNKRRLTPFWYSGVIFGECNRLTRRAKSSDANRLDVVKRNKQFAKLESSDEFKYLAAQLRSAGFRTSCVGRILNVGHLVAGQWIKEAARSVDPALPKENI